MIHAQVTFYIRDDVEEKLRRKAYEVDRDSNMGNDPLESPDAYTLPQAIQVVWHAEPDWLHQHVLNGWTLDKTLDEDGTYRSVWP